MQSVIAGFQNRSPENDPAGWGFLKVTALGATLWAAVAAALGAFAGLLQWSDLASIVVMLSFGSGAISARRSGSCASASV